MKVMIIISNVGVGGSQRVAISLVNFINSLNEHDQAVIVSLDNFDGKKYDISSIPNFQIQPGSSKTSSLIRIIRQQNPDIVLSMGTPMAVYTAPACVVCKVPHVISERNDPSHFSGRSITRILSRLAMLTANGFVFQTRDAQNFYNEKIAKRSVVIPNPLNKVESMPITPYLGTRKKTVVSVGRLNRQKNQKMLIEAFAKLSAEFPDYTLTIWGEGTERGNLEEQIHSLGMTEKIFLPGTSDKVFDEIYDEGVFVLCSDFEGMPNALMEAMALGLPCISTDCPCGGPKDLIEDGVNGMLVPVNDEHALIDAIRKVISNHDFAAELSQHAILIRQTYSQQEICCQWVDYLKSVLSNQFSVCGRKKDEN